MHRPTAFSSLTKSVRAALAGAIALAAAVACDTYTTSVVLTPAVTRVHVASMNVVLPDSLKTGSSLAGTSGNFMVPLGPVANVLRSPLSRAATTAAGACGGTGEAPEYTESRLLETTPDESESSPNLAAFASDLRDDGAFVQSIGFDFKFYGNTYNSVTVFSNGFLAFGDVSLAQPANGGFIPSPSTPNNLIALAWADWSPQLVTDGIRFETRGTAPSRKFLLEFNNVPEYHSTGVVTSLVVLTEGTNDIKIYTKQMSTMNSGHLITQGIENLAGTSAYYDTFLNAQDIPMARVKNFFKLQDDAIQFTPVSTADQIAPTFTATPVDLSQNNDPGLATAVVAVAPPSADDNCSLATVTGVRSDGVPSLDAPYPVGTTTITWTAKDADGNTSTATQTVTVIDNEAPVWDATASSVRQANATSPSGASVTLDNLAVNDNVAVTSVSCEPASGSFFPVGNSNALCTASDAAGNTSSKVFLVTVVNAHDQIGALIERVEALNLPSGTAEPVVNQLLTAYDATADGSAACKKVSDFMTMVQKKNSNIPSGDVTYLLAEGGRILSVMGCPPAPTLAKPASRGNP